MFISKCKYLPEFTNKVFILKGNLISRNSTFDLSCKHKCYAAFYSCCRNNEVNSDNVKQDVNTCFRYKRRRLNVAPFIMTHKVCGEIIFILCI